MRFCKYSGYQVPESADKFIDDLASFLVLSNIRQAFLLFVKAHVNIVVKKIICCVPAIYVCEPNIVTKRGLLYRRLSNLQLAVS